MASIAITYFTVNAGRLHILTSNYFLHVHVRVLNRCVFVGPNTHSVWSHSEQSYSCGESRWLLCMDVWWRWRDQLWAGYHLAHHVHPLLLCLLVQAHLQGLQVSQK